MADNFQFCTLPAGCVVHIGFPKAASTWLQEAVVANLPKVMPIGKPKTPNQEYADFFAKLCSVNELEFDPDAMRHEFVGLYQTHQASRPTADKTMVSMEYLSGDYFTGVDSKQLMDRVKLVFGNVKILIIIR
ncbi:MAG: hypothetical protein JJ900_12850 [Rhodospirillales bacterium]|nr:hypothetical protein [Rhodospirillales bacterium]MBO6787734.1 hypothetical protein [Rhodospirillales bacterium]